jgi:hypothetical protein
MYAIAGSINVSRLMEIDTDSQINRSSNRFANWFKVASKS